MFHESVHSTIPSEDVVENYQHQGYTQKSTSYFLLYLFSALLALYSPSVESLKSLFRHSIEGYRIRGVDFVSFEDNLKIVSSLKIITLIALRQ